MDPGTEGARSHENGNKLTPYEKEVMRGWRVVSTGPTGNTADVPIEDIAVSEVDLKIKENTEANNTSDYDIVKDKKTPQLVVRRGQAFDITITCTRPYDITKDDLRIILEFGDKALPSKGSYVVLKPWDKDPPQNEWKTFPEPIDGNRLHIAVLPPANCPVAKWKLKIDVVKTSEKTVYRYFNEDRFVYILFNAWCKDDLVFMENGYMGDVDLDGREEYVMNENGAIYRGSYWNISRLGWYFGQFDGIVLDCVMYLLDNVSEMKDSVRGDPIRVTRAISSMVNNFDNNGVLAGKWSKPYTNGKEPWKWSGSVKILEQYFENKSPVKYAQCWVFSGVVTTVCRALGIPARSVTNFASAHDTDESITIDVYFDDAGELIKNFNTDSVWNYHVWNETWMSRPDLPPGYGGWQAIDATPQERSRGGNYCMGPMSVKAVKEGNVSLMYDGPFLFAEVNADKLYWYPDDLGNLRPKPTKIDKYSIGKNISTKLPLGTTRRAWLHREDITHEYKFEDGSAAERVAIKKANVHSKRDNLYTEQEWDTKFEPDINPATPIGETFTVNLKIKNNSDFDRTIHGKTTVKSTDYTGDEHASILSRSFWGSLKPQEERLVNYDVPFDDYFDKLADDQSFLKTTCLYKVDETHHIFSDIQQLELTKPSLSIEGPEKGIANQAFTVKATFKNPIPRRLTECEVTVDGHGIRRVTDTSLKLDTGLSQETLISNFTPARRIKNTKMMYPVTAPPPTPNDVAEGGLFEYSCELVQEKTGTREILFTFNSKELHSIDGSHEMDFIKGDSDGLENPPVDGSSEMEVHSAGDSNEMEVTSF